MIRPEDVENRGEPGGWEKLVIDTCRIHRQWNLSIKDILGELSSF